MIQLTKSNSTYTLSLLKHIFPELYVKNGDLMFKDPLGYDHSVISYQYLSVGNNLKCAVIEIKTFSRYAILCRATGPNKKPSEVWYMSMQEPLEVKLHYVEFLQSVAVTVTTADIQNMSYLVSCFRRMQAYVSNWNALNSILPSLSYGYVSFNEDQAVYTNALGVNANIISINYNKDTIELVTSYGKISVKSPLARQLEIYRNIFTKEKQVLYLLREPSKCT